MEGAGPSDARRPHAHSLVVGRRHRDDRTKVTEKR